MSRSAAGDGPADGAHARTEPTAKLAASAQPRPEPAAKPADSTQAHRDPAAVRQFIERFTALLTQAGFPRTPARIFVALLTADSSSMTAAQLADLLQASPASVSGGARYLVQVGLVVAEGEPGSRRQHYRMSVSVWQDIVALRDRQFIRWAEELRDGVRVLGADSPAGLRILDTVHYFEFISEEMTGLLARWKQLNSGR